MKKEKKGKIFAHNDRDDEYAREQKKSVIDCVYVLICNVLVLNAMHTFIILIFGSTKSR